MDRWRVGRTVGRTIYRQLGDDPSKGDELAELVVAALNRYEAEQG